VKVNVWPMTVEMILRANRRDIRLIGGVLWETILTAASERWPEAFTARPSRSLLQDHDIELDEPPPDETKPWRAVWRRFAERREDEQGQ
jgi:hypothetical protein